MVSTWMFLLLLSLWSLQVRVHVNEQHVTGLPQQSQAADAVVVLHPVAGEEWSMYPSNKKPPSTLRIVQPGATFIAVNFQQLNLFPRDKLVVRDPSGSMSVNITAAFHPAQTIETSNESPYSVLLRTHPFLIKGNTVVIEYIPSIPTLMLPVVPRRDSPVVVMDSYLYVTYSSSMVGVDTESTVGAKDEAKEAVCFRKTQPKMYAKARAVARLMIRTQEEQRAEGSEQVTSWSFCTGWLIGRGNYLLTNHHCIKDAVVVDRDRTEGVLSSVISQFWPRSGTSSLPNRAGRVVEAVVGFMAETKSCRDAGFMGEKVGIVEATRVSVITENPALDYALLRVLTNGSATELARRYGYLRLRAAGPKDGEAIYIPQHPRGEPKEIAATKEGKPAVIEISASSSIDSSRHFRGSDARSIQPTVWYNADTEPGSSGSPVLSRKDNTVVALHRAGNSETAQSTSTELFNMGVRVDLVARDLERRNVLPRNALAS
ncbi:Trypsin-like peptidase domain [Phytophthora infestans]|nr:Trypsin-like peptidase domain [Phytophthora infestans]